MKLSLLFAAALFVAGCGAAESVNSDYVPGNDSGSAVGNGNGSSSGGSGSSSGGTATMNDAGTGSSSGGDDGGTTTTADSGSSSGGGDDGGSHSSGNEAGGGDDGGSTTAADSGSGSSSGGGDDGGATVADGGSGSSSGGGDDGGSTTSNDSGSGGGGDDGGVATVDSGSGGSADSGGGSSADSGGGGNTDGGSSCTVPTCVYTQGYYKTHTSAVTALTLGNTSYTQSEVLAFLNDMPNGDDSLILAKQLIAALLNGGACDPNASATVAAAQSWMAANGTTLPYGTMCVLPSDPGCTAYSLGQTLDSYNSGYAGTPHCQ